MNWSMKTDRKLIELAKIKTLDRRSVPTTAKVNSRQGQETWSHDKTKRQNEEMTKPPQPVK
jgi:hypothetical protein